MGEGESVPIVSRLLPLIVLMAVLIAGALTPATSLVEEKEKADSNGTPGHADPG